MSTPALALVASFLLCEGELSLPIELDESPRKTMSSVHGGRQHHYYYSVAALPWTTGVWMMGAWLLYGTDGIVHGLDVIYPT